jgi:transposase
MIQISLNQEEEKELQEFRRRENSRDAEHALIVLKNTRGMSAPAIAAQLELHVYTVRKWLNNYITSGIDGLKRKFATGKSPELRIQVQSYLEEVIELTPEQFGYPVSLWTTALFQDWLSKEKQIISSQDTIERALKDSGYHYKRSRKAVIDKAPSKEEKLEKMSELLESINNKVKEGNCEVFALDESHFSNEPYVVSGWQKKLWFKTNTNTDKEREKNNVWLLKFKNKEILLEECVKR